MGLEFRWVGEDELDRVAETRMYCYAPAMKDLERYRTGIRNDRRAKPGDYLLAEHNGESVGTTTSISFTMWVRGAPLPCQGIAYVGTIKTHRRFATRGQPGIASQLMIHALDKARERQQVVSALMPFRASFYEHFGYGLVETQNAWTVPLNILPHGEFEGFQFVRSEQDLHGAMDCRQRMVEAGQCDIERSREAWEKYRLNASEGYEVIDRGADGSVRGYMHFVDSVTDGRRHASVEDQVWTSMDAFRRQLHFLASLKDQYSAAVLLLPRDLPLNWMLRETQIPHRPVEHAAAKLAPATRMQVRVLDHKRFVEALKLPSAIAGSAVVAVRESEGNISKFRVEIADGRAAVSPTDASADLECPDTLWAAIACGDMAATDAAQYGLLSAANSGAIAVLDAFFSGPAPFCAEYF